MRAQHLFFLFIFCSTLLLSGCYKDETLPEPEPEQEKDPDLREGYVVSTFAGSGKEGTKDGTATEAEFSNEHALTKDASGNIYTVAVTWNHREDIYSRIRRIAPNGEVTTLVDLRGYGFADGPLAVHCLQQFQT